MSSGSLSFPPPPRPARALQRSLPPPGRRERSARAPGGRTTCATRAACAERRKEPGSVPRGVRAPPAASPSGPGCGLRARTGDAAAAAAAAAVAAAAPAAAGGGAGWRLRSLQSARSSERACVCVCFLKMAERRRAGQREQQLEPPRQPCRWRLRQGSAAPAAPAGVLCVPAAVRREPLHDRVRYLQGLVPRQVNKPLQPCRRRRRRPPANRRCRRAGRSRCRPPGRRAAPSAYGPAEPPGPGSGARGAPGSPGARRA